MITRSNPERLFEQSRIVTPLARNCPGMEQFLMSSAQLLAKAPALSVCINIQDGHWFVSECAPDLSTLLRLHATIHTQTIHAPR
jgi:hypothetical protein